ncbi:hypothetical protein LPJ56_004988, partial [Coemansia sp. RSA 2599]
PLKPILMNGDEEEAEEVSPKPASGRRLGPHHNSLKIVRVSCIKYPDASDEDDEEEEEEQKEEKKGSGNADDDDAEYIPKKSIRNSRKK